jgi:hypothetical protein
MPIICFKQKIQLRGYNENVSFAFNCEYDENFHLKLKDYNPNYFDSGDFRIKIDDAITNLNEDLLLEYENKNNGVFYLALLEYFYDTILGLYSIKFESSSGDSIYYVSEIKDKN